MKKKITGILLIICMIGSTMLTGYQTAPEDKVLKDLPICWDLTELYADLEAFEADIKRADELLPELEKFRGTLNTPEGILSYYEAPVVEEIEEIIYKAYLYTSGLASLDISDPLAIQAASEFNDIHMKYQLATAFEEPEIMEMPLEKRIELFSDERLEPYAYYSRAYTDPDKEVLSEEAEKARTLMRSACNNEKTRNILDYVELPLPTITYPDGTEETLTETVYRNILKSPEYDQKFRKEANKLYNSTRQPYAGTYASLLEGQMRRHWADAQLDGFDSTLEAALHETDVDPKVYNRMIRFVHDMLPKLHEYFEAKKKILGNDQLLFSDLDVPVSDYEPKKMSYEAAVNSGRKALTIWGDDYLDIFDRILTAPHVDVYPSAKKEAGGYTDCWGSETMPYVLLNYDGMETYTSIIVHEMGHAVHFELSRENQNRYNNRPNIFTGEVASLSNELTFVKYRYENAETEAEKLYWLDQIIDLFYSALFRQILLSEFEDHCYKLIEKGGSLEADDLADKWLALHREYCGKAVTISDDFGIDWARVPHFYTDYYVYQYATSLTYAAAVCRMVEEAGSPEEKRRAVNGYLDFLKSGGSDDPASLLKIAGVDILEDKTYEAAEEYISGLIDEFVDQSAE